MKGERVFMLYCSLRRVQCGNWTAFILLFGNMYFECTATLPLHDNPHAWLNKTHFPTTNTPFAIPADPGYIFGPYILPVMTLIAPSYQ
ncbi:hypothetical protein V6N11_033351 [Hibiscus sabdariffa]|uniref:Secreted protein n=1 Tax=Hibiscus sabdariffa TaxID=183260 RepID=A0ABR2PXS2_9ROSI